MVLTVEPYVETFETNADLLARLEARDAEIDRLNRESIRVNQRMSSLEKIIGKAPTPEKSGHASGCSSSVVNPIFEEEGDAVVQIENPQVPNRRGKQWYFE